MTGIAYASMQISTQAYAAHILLESMVSRFFCVLVHYVWGKKCPAYAAHFFLERMVLRIFCVLVHYVWGETFLDLGKIGVGGSIYARHMPGICL